MAFILGIHQLASEEKITLLAQFKAIQSHTLLQDHLFKTSHKVKDFTLRVCAKTVKPLSKPMAKNLMNYNDHFCWDTEVLQRKIEAEINRLSLLSITAVDRELHSYIKSLAGVSGDVDDRILARAIVYKVAEHRKIKSYLYEDVESLETAVFQELLTDRIEQMKKTLKKMSPGELDRMESMLREELERLGEVDKEEIRRSLGLEKLSASALMQVIKTTSSVALAQILVSSFGFGSYLFITSLFKAFSLLFGVTLPFAVYTTATSALALLMSSMFLFTVAAFSSGFIFYGLKKKIRHGLSETLIMVGKANLMRSIG